MNLKVLRPADGNMLKLVQYNAINGSDTEESAEGTIHHNHILKPATQDVALTFGGAAQTVSVPGVATYTTVPTDVSGLATIATDVSNGTVTVTPKSTGTDGSFEITVKDATGAAIGDINVTVTTVQG